MDAPAYPFLERSGTYTSADNKVKPNLEPMINMRLSPYNLFRLCYFFTKTSHSMHIIPINNIFSFSYVNFHKITH